MPKDTGKASATSMRRAELRRSLPRGRRLEGLRSAEAGWAVVVWGVFALACSMLAVWTREQPLVAVGRVMNTTEVVRVGFELEDSVATEEERRTARARTPRVYISDAPVMDELRHSIENLPRTVAGAASAAGVEPQIRAQFGLTDGTLSAVQRSAMDGEPSERWREWTERLMERLAQRPLLDDQTWQRESNTSNELIEVNHAGRTVRIPANDPSIGPVNVQAKETREREQVRRTLEGLARDAGFTGPLAEVVASRLLSGGKPTFRLDEVTTAQRQAEAAANVKPLVRKRTPGQVIFTRGEVLTPEALSLYRAEMDQFRSRAEPWRVWVKRASVAGAVVAVTLALAGYAGLFAPMIRRSPGRAAGVAALLGVALLAACVGTAWAPGLATLTAVAPSVFVAVILCIAYDQRIALALAGLHALLACTALNQPIGIFALTITGIGTAVWLLKEVRDRGSLMRMSVGVTAALALGTVVVALIDRPTNALAVRQLLFDAAWAGAGGLLVGMVTVFILPTLERVFGVVTSMTLIELRDPKHPLLRQLQQRAPGTYNHSLNVANLAEAGAEAIGASGLLTYVGALYHDVGKLNKPDYFVENQAPGINKHDRLSPAMSLLVIVGHVKDGVELAREFNLPGAVHHFIEAHHGTTLVEYFYHRAKKMAAAAAAHAGSGGGNGNGGGGSAEPAAAPPAAPDEIEYRYPGPKPRTKEVAIVMLCDAVESAARSMQTPTPSRIEAVVRALAQKRLMDGQFDECDLTLRELNTVVEAVSKTLASIYHGRVAYPEGEGPKTAMVRLEEADFAPRLASGDGPAAPAAPPPAGVGVRAGG